LRPHSFDSDHKGPCPYAQNLQNTTHTQTQTEKKINPTLQKTKEQELSYRKQIARQLRTQYFEGINNKPVTLKSRLRVTQDHPNWCHSNAWIHFSIRSL